MLLSKLTWQAYSAFLAEPIATPVRFNALDPQGRRHAMSARLLAVIRHFGRRADSLPEWRDAAGIVDPNEIWKIWPSLPVITKSILNDRFEPVELQRRFNLKGRQNATGGSTGEPTRFFTDNAMLRVSRGAHLYSQIRMGWTPGMPTISVWGSDRDIGKQASPLRRVAAYLYSHHMVPGFAITDEDVDRVHSIIRAEQSVAIYGYSSLLEFVAERTLAMGRTFESGRVRVAWNGAEMLYDRQIELFKQAFGVPILNRYGGRELSVTACQEVEGGPLRLIRPWVFAEIVNEAGQPAAPGEVGRLLLTSTASRGTPFIRYDIGDLAVYSEPDRDESGLSAIRALHGRSAGSIRLQDGRVISCIYWNHLLKDFPEVRQFQVRLSRDGRISLLLAGQGFTPTRSAHLTSVLKLVLRDQEVALQWVPDIPRTAQGKLAQVVQE